LNIYFQNFWFCPKGVSSVQYCNTNNFENIEYEISDILIGWESLFFFRVGKMNHNLSLI
jgi:hypothetical protein